MNRPHIYKSTRPQPLWFCSDGRWLGWGPTPLAAHEAWRNRAAANSCVHDRETKLQQRRAA